MPFTNVVASTPTTGGGYPDDATGAPVAGTCGAGSFNANHSESWLAVQPGTENIVGSSKFFFGPWSTFYNFYLGSYTIPNGTPAGNNQMQGYDCVSTGTQAMPPSWTNNTDPNVAWDLEGRVYETTLPFNAYWTNLHPNSAIDVSYSDDMGRHWVKGNGGQDLEQSPNSSSLQLGHVEDKQWIAVNDVALSPYRGHVYAMWSVFNDNTTKIRIAVSRDRGQTFSKAVTITAPSQTGPSNTYIIPSVDAAGNLYIAFTAFPLNANKPPETIYVSRSTDDGQTFSPFVAAVTNVGGLPAVDLPNTLFRDGITENFAASPTYPGHVYLTYEDWDGTQMDVKFTQSTDGGFTWSAPVVVNDAANSSTTDQFQPSVAAGPGGAVAVAVAFAVRRARTTRASSRQTSASRTSASTRRYRLIRTRARERRLSAAATSGSRSSRGIPTSRSSTSAGSVSIRARRTGIPARSTGSSATTSVSQSPTAAFTRCRSRRTTRRASSPTRAAPCTTSNRCWRRCRAPASARGTSNSRLQPGCDVPSQPGCGSDRHSPTGGRRAWRCSRRDSRSPPGSR